MKPAIPIKILALILVAFFSFSIQSCKKNSEFNMSVGFVSGANEKNDFTLRTFSTTQSIGGILKFKTESGLPAVSDTRIDIIDNTNSLLSAYNAAHGTTILPLPVSLWTFPSSVTLPADSNRVEADISVSSTAGLDTNQLYGIGLKITGINEGRIADSLQNLLVVFRISRLNIYDGRYSMHGQFYHPTYEPGFAHHNLVVELHTTGTNSVRLFWPLFGFYMPPMTTNNGQPLGLISSLDLSMEVDPLSNKLTCVNTYPASPVIYESIISYSTNNYNNRWDQVSNTIYAAFGFNLAAGGTVVFGSSRAWIDTLTYLGPR